MAELLPAGSPVRLDDDGLHYNPQPDGSCATISWNSLGALMKLQLLDDDYFGYYMALLDITVRKLEGKPLVESEEIEEQFAGNVARRLA